MSLASMASIVIARTSHVRIWAIYGVEYWQNPYVGGFSRISWRMHMQSIPGLLSPPPRRPGDEAIVSCGEISWILYQVSIRAAVSWAEPDLHSAHLSSCSLWVHHMQIPSWQQMLQWLSADGRWGKAIIQIDGLHVFLSMLAVKGLVHNIDASPRVICVKSGFAII